MPPLVLNKAKVEGETGIRRIVCPMHGGRGQKLQPITISNLSATSQQPLSNLSATARAADWSRFRTSSRLTLESNSKKVTPVK
jgi:hypothetical protein